MHPKPPEVGVNRQFRAKMRKSKNGTVFETVNRIKPKFDDAAATVNYTSWVVYFYCIANPTWLTVANSPIWMKFGMPTQNLMPMASTTSKWKPEVEFQYGGRLFSETGQ